MGALLLGQLTNESAPHLHPLLDADVTGGPGLLLGPLGYILLPDDHLLHVLPLRLGLHTSRPVRINTDTREGGREGESMSLISPTQGSFYIDFMNPVFGE